MTQPNKVGLFGTYGGMFVPDTLMPALTELTQTYLRIKKDKSFQKKFSIIYKIMLED